MESGPILESKSTGTIFQKNSKEMLKKHKLFENMGKNVKKLKIFWKKAGAHNLHTIKC